MCESERVRERVCEREQARECVRERGSKRESERERGGASERERAFANLDAVAEAELDSFIPSSSLLLSRLELSDTKVYEY